MLESTYRKPSPLQKQFTILFTKGNQTIAVNQTVEFIKQGDPHNNIVRVKLKKLNGLCFEGEVLQGHYAAGNLPTGDRPGIITISLQV